MATASASSTLQQGNLYIFIDNSNLWIQGQKTYARARGLTVPVDKTWRFDAGRLKSLLVSNAGVRADESSFRTQVTLYGSTPPPVDTVWRAIGSHDVKVNTFARSSWDRREKLVDGEIIADSMDCAHEAYDAGIPAEFVIVSGDEDLYSAVKRIIRYNFTVHIWSWKNCLSSGYGRRNDKLVQIHLLDGYLEEIGFREVSFRPDRNAINPHSIVILDPLPKADEITKFMTGQTITIPVYRYVTATTRPGASSQDLIIIPVSHSMSSNALSNFYRSGKAQLERQGLSVLSYLEYSQRYCGNSPVELKTSNRFKELPEDGLEEGDIAYADNDGDDDDDGFIEVNSRKKKTQQRLRRNEQLASRRCRWRRYCEAELSCKYGHTKEEESFFKAYGHKKARKHRLCNVATCTWGTRCRYAHDAQELRCLICDKVGVGHGMDQCPQL